MSPSEIRLPPGELERLAECVLEPIRFPGAVQPHGVMLVVERGSFTIRRVSENSAELIGAEPTALFGRAAADLLGESCVAELRDVLDADTVSTNPVPCTIDGRDFDVIVSELDGYALIELEPLAGTPPQPTAAIRTAFRRLGRATTVQELWDTTAREIRAITGFDRVMVYHFHPDAHGEVVAEDAADDMEPYVGLHYPASDIPAQARELYVTKLSRQIVDSSAQPAALLSDANVEDSSALDLSCAELRAVSPHHLQFMRNMGQASTFSLSMVRNGTLVGMITSAHRTVLRVPYGTREGLELLANQVALQLGAMMDIERLARRNAVREIRSHVLGQVQHEHDLASGLLRQHVTLLDLIPADGVLLRLGGASEALGDVPPDAAIDRLSDALDVTAAFASNSLSTDRPELAQLLSPFAGLLLAPLGTDGDYIAWFRREIRQTVDWLGDMSPTNRVTPLSPRNSFSAWTEEVSGTSLPWEELEREASELSRDLSSYLLQRAESRLAEQALRDPLTGLPNRRLLMDRLEQALARQPRGSDVALLFIDVDRFKAINDTYGHAAGDDALIHVAQALTASARNEDTVARLGGDEFVVVCETTTYEQAQLIAARLLEHLAAPPSGDMPWRVEASIGIAMADGRLDASAVLSAADAAMYRAKRERRE